ncbi:head decoration protein [Methylobacter marinus]|uniref:head decoration protein n=1 Tax=Methylobacter marinus TaxID=34058 RepID=UPI000372ED5B|nr:head decoration protein [Methylobacter marinus]
MATLTEKAHAGEFILTEVDAAFREKITVISGQNLMAGTVLGRIETDGATAAADAGNTGDGAMGEITVSAGVQEGDYLLTITAAATNAGNFQVTDPQGDVVGVGTVGAAFSGGGLSFTLADGAADFIVGDTITITVAPGSKKYTLHDPAATDGSQHAAGILYAVVDASLADAKGVGITRLATVADVSLTWKTGISADAKAAAIARMAEQHLLVR